MKRKRPAFRDIVDLASITEMMAGRYLRNPEQISGTLRGKTAVTLNGLGYIPSCAPNILPNVASCVIGVLLLSLTSQIFSEVLRGVEGVTDTFGYRTMLVHYGYKPEMGEKRLESTPSWDIDGLILTERTHTPHALEMIEVTGIPVVELMGNRSPCLDIAAGFDNSEAARQVTAVIIAYGHRHVVRLEARPDKRTIIKRKGHEQVMLDAGMTPYSMMVEQSSSHSSDIEPMHQARRKYPRLDGIFCTNDDLAVGAAFECQRLGLKTPDDMAIVRFHGHDIGQVMEPRLANVLTPRGWVGHIGAERLLMHIRSGTITPKTLDLGSILSPDGST